MPSLLLKRINLDLLYPPFLMKYLDCLAACQKRGAYYFATFGMRTFAEQAKIYFQGRTTPGPIVTNAQAGMSCHNYGIAIDAVRDADLNAVGLQPNWAADGYDILREEAERVGLQWNVSGLKDYGHVQLPLAKKLGRKEAGILAQLKTKYQAAPAGEELKAAWAELDIMGFA